MPGERVQRQIDRLLDEAERAIAAGDWPLVQARAAQVLALDPGSADALAYRDAAARALAQDTAPASRTEQAPAAPPPPLVPAAEAAAGEARSIYSQTFVGRDAELGQLQAAFDAAAAGQGGLVLVVGEPGIGKTTLTEQLAGYTAHHGGRTLVGHCYEEGSLSLPYLPFIEALRSYVLDRDPTALRSELGSGAPEVARLVSEVRDRLQVSPAAPSSDPGEDRYRLFNAVANFLRQAAAAQPLVLVLEDLHDADRGTLELLQFLARQLAGSHLLLVGTYRDVEVDRAHPLSATLAELRRAGSFSRVVLRGLTADEVQRMLSAVASQPVQRPLAEAVFKQTEGNPLFVQEVVRYLAEEGLLEREDGRWRAGACVSLLETIPEGLRDVIGKRLARLSPACNQVLAVAAVIGREFELQTLQAVAPLGDDEVLAALEEAVKVAVLQDTSRPGVLRYRFAHAFFRQTLYEELFAPRRLRLHQQVARALEQQYAGRLDEHAAELAEHFAQSTDPTDLQKAVEYSRRAAVRATAVYAYGEAVRLLEQALQVQELVAPEDVRTRCSLLLDLCDALAAADEPVRIEGEVAEEAFALAERLGDRDAAARAALVALRALSWLGGPTAVQSARGQELARRLERSARPGSSDQVQAAAILYFARLEPAEAAKHYESLLETARRLTDAEAFHWVAWQVLFTGLCDWETVERPLLAELERRTDDGASTLAHALSRHGAAWAWLRQGERERAEAIAGQLHALAERVPDSGVIAVSRVWEAIGLGMDGRLEEAAAVVRKVTGVTGLMQVRVSILFPLFMLGRFADFFALNPTHGPWDAYLFMLSGRTREAEQVLAGLRIESLVLPSAVLVLHGAMLQENVARTREAVARIEHAWRPVTGTWWTLTDRHLGEAYAYLGELTEARRRFEAAIALGQRMRWRPEVALTRLGLAEVLLQGNAAEQAEAREHLAFVLPEFEAMKMGPALAQARDLAPDPSLAAAPGKGDPAAPSSDLVVRDTPQQPATSQYPPNDAARTRQAGSPSPVGREHGERSSAHVFISYSSDDRARAVGLAAALERAGHAVWLDQRSIEGGTAWDAEIVRAIRASSLVTVLVSPRAVRSRNVAQELRLALEFEKPLLPLLLERTEYPDDVRYALAGRQWVELLDHPEADWLPRVLSAVARLQQRSA